MPQIKIATSKAPQKNTEQDYANIPIALIGTRISRSRLKTKDKIDDIEEKNTAQSESNPFPMGFQIRENLLPKGGDLSFKKGFRFHWKIITCKQGFIAKRYEAKGVQARFLIRFIQQGVFS